MGMATPYDCVYALFALSAIALLTPPKARRAFFALATGYTRGWDNGKDRRRERIGKRVENTACPAPTDKE